MSKSDSIIWTSSEAAAVTGGIAARNWCATGVSLSVSDIKPGDLFIASADDDLEQVFAKGAAAAMVSGKAEVKGDYPLLRVPGVFEALQSLASAGRYKTHGTVVGYFTNLPSRF